MGLMLKFPWKDENQENDFDRQKIGSSLEINERVALQ